MPRGDPHRAKGIDPTWAAKLGEQHTLDIPTLGAVSETALTREVEIAMCEGGLPNTFVPGRNLIFLTFAAALAYRRGIRHIVTGVCETDYSGYPDCRDDTIKAMQVAINLGMERRFVLHTPLMWRDKAATWALAHALGGEALVDWSARTPIPAISACAISAMKGLWLRRMPRLPLARGWLEPLCRARRQRESLKIAEDQRRIEGYVFLAAYIACIPLANWLIGHAGTVCVPQGPCLVPVAPGLMAPSGVLLIGLALVLRDLVQRRLGIAYALAAIVVGAALSGLLAPLPLVVASATAFLLSELADFAVYTPLQKRGLVLAVVPAASSGSSQRVVFLWLAFGSLDFLLGQIVGKAWMVLLTLPRSIGCAAATRGSAWRGRLEAYASLVQRPSSRLSKFRLAPPWDNPGNE